MKCGLGWEKELELSVLREGNLKKKMTSVMLLMLIWLFFFTKSMPEINSYLFNKIVYM